MPETFDIAPILILLAAAVLAVPIFHRFGLGAVLGYLFAGALIGPWGLAVIADVEAIQPYAKLGIVFLLFVIGIELNFNKLWAMKKLVFGLGTAQVMVTAAALGGVALFFHMSIQTAIIIGFGLALSSTAFGLQILSERKGLKTVSGNTSFSILLLQDISVVPILALVPFLAYSGAPTGTIDIGLLTQILIACGGLIAVIAAGRFLLSPALKIVAASRNSELFVAATILVVLGTGWLMESVGLSMALGAFLAGLILADSHYRHQIMADIQPFRGLLLGLFFMSVGMAIDFGLLLQQAPLIIMLVVLLLLIKTLIIFALCRITGIANGPSVHAALLLSQSGEFGFVIFGLAYVSGLMPLEVYQVLTLVIALSMITTPFMAKLGVWLEKHVDEQVPEHSEETTAITPPAVDNFVIIAGFGRMGRRVADILESGDVPYLALDRNPVRVAKARAQNQAVIYGDAGRYDVLNQMGAERASIFVVTIDEAAAAERLVYIMRQHYPNTPIYARGRDLEHCEKLYEAGATLAVSETLEASLTLSRAVLEVSGIEDENISGLLEVFRKNHDKTSGSVA